MNVTVKWNQIELHDNHIVSTVYTYNSIYALIFSKFRWIKSTSIQSFNPCNQIQYTKQIRTHFRLHMCTREFQIERTKNTIYIVWLSNVCNDCLYKFCIMERKWDEVSVNFICAYHSNANILYTIRELRSCGWMSLLLVPNSQACFGPSEWRCYAQFLQVELVLDMSSRKLCMEIFTFEVNNWIDNTIRQIVFPLGERWSGTGRRFRHQRKFGIGHNLHHTDANV